MNIYFYGVFNNKGGMENYALNLISAVTPIDTDIHYILLAVTSSVAFQEEFLALGCEIKYLPAHGRGYRKALKPFFASLDEGDIIQINAMSYRNAPLFHYAKKSKAQLITVAHGAGIEGTRFRFLHYLFRSIYSRHGHRVAVSDEAALFMYGTKDNIEIIPHQIDANRFAFDEKKRNRIRSNLGISSDVFLFGFVGRLAPIKNPLFALEFFRSFYQKNPNSMLLFVGKEQYEEPLKAAQKYELGNSVFFLGEQESADYYSALDILLFPSLHEGAGLTLMEALASGLPVIASDRVPKVSSKSKDDVLYLPLDIPTWLNHVPKPSLERKNKLIQADSVYLRYIELYRSLSGAD